MDNNDPVSNNTGAKREAGDESNRPAAKRLQLVHPPIRTSPPKTFHEAAPKQNPRYSMQPSVARDPLPSHFEATTRNSERISMERRRPDGWTNDIGVPLIAQVRILSQESGSMRNCIARPELDVRQTTGDPASVEQRSDQRTKLKIQLATQDEANGGEVELLRKRNANLEEDKLSLKTKVMDLENKLQRSITEISELSLDLRERETLYRETFRAEQNTNLRQSSEVNAIMKENKKLKKSVQMHERRMQVLEEERDTLLKRSMEGGLPSTHYEAELDLEKERFKYLQTQKEELEKEYRQRGSTIIQLTRDLESLRVNSKIKKAVEEGKRNMLVQLRGMFVHYRTLHEKNTALLAKLKGMVKAGGFGHFNSNYRKELDALEGLPVEELKEYKSNL
jgi:hypothetical protein